MGSLTERFNKPLPEWLWGEKQKFFMLIWQSKLMQACKRGDLDAMKVLMIRYWPFVDDFPEIIRKHQLRIFIREFLRHPVDSLFLLDTVTKVLEEIRGDEWYHRSLWLDTSNALGLDEKDLYRKEKFYGAPEPEVYKIMQKVGEPVSILGNGGYLSSTVLFRLAGVEIVAEGISVCLIREFEKISNSAARWFDVHIHHKDGMMSHEELVYRVAFALDDNLQKSESGSEYERDEKEAERRKKVVGVIGEVVDLFIEAGEVPY